jgi:hypothetical protein
MKRIRVIGWLVAAAMGAALASSLPAVSAEGADPLVELRWALATSDAASKAPSAVKKDTQLPTGSRLKFFLEPLSPCSVYLLLLDSQNEMQVLYHEKAKVAAATAQGSSPTYVPPGSQWFELEEGPGRETFFLLASAEPLPALETMIGKLASADAAMKKTLATQISDEIRRLQKAHRNFSRPVEKPVMIGGQTRSAGAPAASIDRLAVEISAERFYDKTITIEH